MEQTFLENVSADLRKKDFKRKYHLNPEFGHEHATDDDTTKCNKANVNKQFTENIPVNNSEILKQNIMSKNNTENIKRSSVSAMNAKSNKTMVETKTEANIEVNKN